MTEDTQEIIKNYPGISMADARLIFIRNAGRDAFKARSANAFEAIQIPGIVKDATRDEVINYIGFLDTMVKELKAYQQGLEIEYAREIEPEIEANHKEREASKDAKRSAPATLGGMVKKVEFMGMNKADLIAALRAQIAKEEANK